MALTARDGQLLRTEEEYLITGSEVTRHEAALWWQSFKLTFTLAIVGGYVGAALIVNIFLANNEAALVIPRAVAHVYVALNKANAPVGVVLEDARQIPTNYSVPARVLLETTAREGKRLVWFAAIWFVVGTVLGFVVYSGTRKLLIARGKAQSLRKSLSATVVLPLTRLARQPWRPVRARPPITVKVKAHSSQPLMPN
jgi:hypothetical protein